MDSSKVLIMDNTSESRLWQTLDAICERLTGIETQMTDIVRLQERLTNHEEALSRYGRRLDDHSHRIRTTELWLADHGDPSACSHAAMNLRDDIKLLASKEDVSAVVVRVKDLEGNGLRNTGQKDVAKEMLKWASVVLASIVVYFITRKS